MKYLIRVLPSEVLMTDDWKTIDGFDDPSVVMEHIESPTINYFDYMLVRCIEKETDSVIYTGIHHREILHNITYGSEWMNDHGFVDSDTFNMDYAEGWRRCPSANAMLTSLTTYCSRQFVVNALLDIVLSFSRQSNYLQDEISNIRRMNQLEDPQGVAAEMLRVGEMVIRWRRMGSDIAQWELAYEIYACLNAKQQCGTALENFCYNLANGNRLTAIDYDKEAADALRVVLNFKDVAREICANG